MAKRRRRRERLPNEVRQATIESLSHEGRGVATVNGKKVFIHNALPGEQVDYRVSEVHAKYDCGYSVAIEQVNEHRVEPMCEFYKYCGGCQMQHIAPGEQLALKERVLKEQLHHFGNVEPVSWLSPLQDKTQGYRHKARLGIRHRNGQTLIGFRERNGKFITKMNACAILHPTMSGALEGFADVVNTLSICDKIPQVEFAAGDKHIALIIRHLDAFNETDLDKLAIYADKTGFHLYGQSKGPDTVTKLFPIEGAERLHYQLADFDLTLGFHPTDFTQVNPFINRQMLAQAMSLLAPCADDKILDLFCGLGNFTLPIACSGAQTVGVEGCDKMVQRAQENAQANHLNNCSFYAANLHETLKPASWINTSYDKLLIDPPRSGAELLVKNMQLFAPKRIVYVSCNPATLARDAGILVHTHGYQLEQAGIMDMFPHTAHVEAMALFTR